MNKIWHIGTTLVSSTFLILLFLAHITWRAHSIALQHTYSPSTAPHAEAVIILGGGVYRDGRLSDVVRDRADTALELYRSQKISYLLVSGDHGTKEHDEVNAIRKYLQQNNVPTSSIFLDHAGFDTYDSLYRARAVFDVSSVIIPTQAFHLPRALYIANNLQIEAYGVAADKHTYKGATYYSIREFFARGKAFFNTHLYTKPTHLGQKIPVTGDSMKSWDQH